MDQNSIFITQTEKTKVNDISGKVTYTGLLNTIPENNTETQLKDWKNQNKTEWRWRFLKLPEDRHVVEISYMKPDLNKRMFFNRYGEWVEREMDPIFDTYVSKQCYYYTDN
jgi:hypothetical protein